MSTTAYFNDDTQKYLVEGLNLVANAVKATLGPAGNTVIIQREDKTPLITKDGVSVAKEIHPKDERVKLGADLAISVAQKQMGNCGDGTSTSTVLAQALVNAGIRQISFSDSALNRTSVRRGIEKARDYVIHRLDDMSKKIETDDELVHIATVSANGDEKLGGVVAEAYKKVGKNGVVLVEETKNRDITLDFKEGMTFNKGWTSQFFITNHEDQSVEFEDARLLLCESKISNFATLAQLIQQLANNGKPLVIIAESYDNAVIQALAMNIVRSKGQLKIACVEAPGYGQRRLDILRDIATYTGATVADDPMGIKLEGMTVADFGVCDKIIIKKDETVIRGGKGDADLIKERINSIEGLIKATKENDNFEREQLNKRLAALTTGIAVIQVGGSSEEEIKELKDRLDDAQWAVKAALEEGYVPGSGNTLLHLSEELKIALAGDNYAERIGIEIFTHALKAPIKTILENAGQPSEVIINELVKCADVKKGFNAKTLEYTDLLEAGIIDPKKVVAGAVYAASSIASVVLTSSVMITQDPIENSGVNFNMMPPGMI